MTEIPMGFTCGGWFGGSNECTTGENRKLESLRHEPLYEQLERMQLKNRNQIIINFDSYNSGNPRGWTSTENLRKLVDDTISTTFKRAEEYGLRQSQVKKLVTVTFDNEFDEIGSVKAYCAWARLFRDQVNGRFDIGLGNFGGLKESWYDYVCQNVSGFKYLDIHLQEDFDTIDKVNANLPKLAKIAQANGKELRVTEAFPTNRDLWTNAGYALLIHQLNKSIEYGAKAFCCFIRFDRSGDYRKLAFLRGTDVHDRWNDFKGLIQAYKPKIDLEDEMDLKEIYKNGMRYETGVNFIQMVLNEDIKPQPLLKVDGWWGPLTNPIVLQYQDKYNLSSYEGAIGPNTFQHMMSNYPLIWDRFQYLYYIRKIK